MATQRTSQRRTRRTAVTLVLTVVMLVVLCGFAALTVDVGLLYNTRADLQRTADAAALAAAGQLANLKDADPVGRARQAAVEYVERNGAIGRTKLTVDPDEDVVFGQANYDLASNSYEFDPTDVLPDTVRVRVRMTEGSANGPVSLLFARVFGLKKSDVSAEAMALMTPRDISIVADLSASINDDSELRSYKDTDINLFEVWDGLPGGDDETAPCAGVVCNDGETCVNGTCVPVGPGALAGPAWGYFNELGFGVETLNSSYNPTTDAGLVYLPYNANWTDAALSTFLTTRGYSAGEITNILSSGGDGSGAYPYRVAVALGLADWTSGLTGGRWASVASVSGVSGDKDTRVESGEVVWVESLFGQSMSNSATIWVDYINDYMRDGNSRMAQANSAFRYRFGLKTFVNYLLEVRASHAQTPELADAPAQPMQAVKDAAMYMTKLLTHLQTNDQISLEVFATTARHEVDLTSEFDRVTERMSEFQAGHYDSSTNMGAGIAEAIQELTGSRARGVSRKVIVLLTDGIPNIDESGRSGESGGAAYALAQAERAAALGIKVFAVSVGSGADQTIMKQIASIGRGEHFHAEGSIENYSAELAKIFMQIGAKRSVELIY